MTNRAPQFMLEPRGLKREQAAHYVGAKERPVYIAGSVSNYGLMIGCEPGWRDLPYFKGRSETSEAQARANLREQAELLAEAGVDFLLAEATGSTTQRKWVIEACVATGLPVWMGFKCRQDDDDTTVTAPMEKPLTIKQLSQLTGLESRTLQFWTMNGVIECDPETRHAGPGKPRRYSQDEAVVALVLSEIIRMPLQVGALREIAERFREIMNYGPNNGVTDPVHWESSDDGDIMMQEVRRLKKEGSLYEASLLVDKYYGLQAWSWVQFAISGTRSYISSTGTRRPIGDHMLELAVDDIGRWQLAIHYAAHYKEEETDTDAPPVWSLRLVLNLTRTFARLQPPREPNFASGVAPDD